MAETTTGQDDAPLAGTRIAGIVTHGVGPSALRRCALLGAHAFKIEHKRGLDGGREMPPMRVAGMSPFHEANNTSVQSLSLDYTTDPGQCALVRVLRRCDGFVSNMKEQINERYGLTWEALQAAEARFFPDQEPELRRLICIRVTGYGVRGPMRLRSGYATNVDAWTGTMDLNVGPEGVPQRPPTPDPDWMAARDVVTCFLLGLIRRARTGRGGQFNISLAGERIEALNYQAVFALNQYLQVQHQPDSEHPSVPTARVIQTADEPLLVMIMTDAQWRKMCTVVGREDLVQDPRFATQDSRQNNRRALRKILRAAFAARPAAEWMERLEQADLPVDQIRSIYDLRDDPQVWANDMLVRITGSPLGPEVIVPGMAIEVEGLVPQYRRAPYVGEHTREILAAAAFSDAEIAALRSEGVVGWPEA
jgi:CoA:oxalate CoA-transferase